MGIAAARLRRSPQARELWVTAARHHGRWYEAELLDKHRREGGGGPWCATPWRSGMRYMRGEWADELRPAGGAR